MHTHEQWIHGKRYLNEIKSCTCEEKVMDEFKLECTIHQRGKHYYYTTKKADRIVRDGTKTWYLTEDARKTVRNSLRRFERGVASVESGNNVVTQFEKEGIVLTIKRRSKSLFDAVLRYQNIGEMSVIRLIRRSYIGCIIKETAFIAKTELSNLLYNTTEETISENQIFNSSVRSSDELLPIQIRLFYRIADGDDCRKLERITSERVLPTLGKAYDRILTIPMNEIDFNLIRRSGYCICHRPCFAMKGYTHSLCEINPHTKTGVDAGKEEDEITSFQTFLKLFG